MAYTSGKYSLLYYKEIERENQVVRLEILQRARRADWTPKEIGELQALTLEIDGEDDPVAPIQKTLLSFSMVDTYDIADTDDVKHGNWEELYTPDSTLFMVVVKTRSKSGTAFTTRWSGYITPDNWEEELDYRGSITITARDNVGHLQDFDFDMPADGNGTATIKDILDTAFFRVAFPMDITYLLTDSEDVVALKYDNTSLPNFRVNVAQFEGKTWYDAVESIMSSLGLCLRYVDYNRMSVTYLRYMPMLGTDLYQEVIHRPVIFLGGGKRTLDPAYKRIVETVKYDTEAQSNYNSLEGLDLNSGIKSYAFKIQDISVPSGSVFDDNRYVEGSARYQTNYSSSIGGWQSGGAFLSVAGYSADATYGGAAIYDEKTTVLLAANSKNSEFTQTYGFGIVHTPAGKIIINICRSAFAVNAALKKISSMQTYLARLKYAVKYVAGNKTYYWTGSSWSQTESWTTVEFEDNSNSAIELEYGRKSSNSSQVPGDGALYLAIGDIEFKTGFFGHAHWDSDKLSGAYLGITSLALEIFESSEELSSDTVTTINNELYNVTCNRSPEIGFLSRDVIWQTPQNYMNALYYLNSEFLVQPVGYKLMWGNATATEEPFPAILHRQILCYHRIASQVLDGECMREDKYGWSFDEVLTYKGHKFILVKGVYDMLSGVMSSATLREFEEYDDVWGTTQMTTTEN